MSVACVPRSADVLVFVVDADDHYDLFENSGGTQLPYTIMVDRSGREVGRMTGFKPDRFDELLVQAQGKAP